MNSDNPLRIGGASGYWGDAALATAQLLSSGGLDFIVYDYLAEITMAILARSRARDPAQGFAGDFITAAMVPNLAAIAKQGVRVISNAGGVNPEACAKSLRAEIEKQGLGLTVATVLGDDLMTSLPEIAGRAPHEMFSGADFPDQTKVASVNAYLGAFPIAAALASGADIVVTGRCVDSAVTLGACIHHFGWGSGDLDQLAGGALAGHILECGTQATGGNFTDWHRAPDFYENMGYPIAEIRRDGAFDVIKPAQTGGQVSIGTIAEQMVYEIGDPQAYVLPDVGCDFSEVVLAQTGPDRVRVSGAKGRYVPGGYKTCLTWHDGYRAGHLFSYYGLDAEAKAQVFAAAAIARARAALRRMNAPDFTAVSTEAIGTCSQFGALAQAKATRELTLKIAVRHPEARGVMAFIRESTGLSLAAPPGLSGFAGARPKPMPVLALFSFLTDKTAVTVSITGQDGPIAFDGVARGTSAPAIIRPKVPEPNSIAEDEVALVDLAWGRSGDKGDNANVGIIARDHRALPWIWANLSDAFIRETYAHFLAPGAKIERFYLPGISAMNILLHRVLDGGGTSSLRNDPQGKGYAQLLLARRVKIDATAMKEWAG